MLFIENFQSEFDTDVLTYEKRKVDMYNSSQICTYLCTKTKHIISSDYSTSSSSSSIQRKCNDCLHWPSRRDTKIDALILTNIIVLVYTSETLDDFSSSRFFSLTAKCIPKTISLTTFARLKGLNIQMMVSFDSSSIYSSRLHATWVEKKVTNTSIFFRIFAYTLTYNVQVHGSFLNIIYRFRDIIVNI